MTQHTTPCKECPFTRKSAPGYLGASNAMEFLEHSESGMKMPCHMTVDYENELWQADIDAAPECAGRAIHFANRAKNGECVSKMDRNTEAVFVQPQEFLDHHMHGKAPKVMIIGHRVVPI